MATREAYGNTLKELGAKYPNLVVMDGDLSGSTKTAVFAKEYPERFFNMGIAEQNMYGERQGWHFQGSPYALPPLRCSLPEEPLR